MTDRSFPGRERSLVPKPLCGFKGGGPGGRNLGCGYRRGRPWPEGAGAGASVVFLTIDKTSCRLRPLVIKWQ